MYITLDISSKILADKLINQTKTSLLSKVYLFIKSTSSQPHRSPHKKMFRCRMLDSEIQSGIQFEVSRNIHLDGGVDVIVEVVRFEIVGVIGLGNAIQTFDDGVGDG